MLLIFAVFLQPLKRISYWKCFITVGAWKHLHWLNGIAIFAPVGPLNSWERKGWVEPNRLSTCIESTLMSRNDFNLHRVDSYRHDFVSKWPNSDETTGFPTMVDVEIKVGTTGLPDIDDKLGGIDAAKFKACASPSRKFWKTEKRKREERQNKWYVPRWGTTLPKLTNAWTMLTYLAFNLRKWNTEHC